MDALVWITPVLLTVITASTPLLLAATGELVTERAGVLNLGLEGMMLVGAILALATASATGSMWLGSLAGMLGGGGMGLLFGVLTLSLLANQVASGLALTLFGIGLSALIGSAYIGVALTPMARLNIPWLSDLPFVGPVFFGQDPLVYASLILLVGVNWFLFRTRAGLIMRAVGESHEAAHSIGYPVVRTRYLAAIFGGSLAGLGGAYLSLIYTPLWTEGMTAGRGWIALALVVFSSWLPGRLFLGAYLFGAVSILQLHAQGWGVNIPPQFMSMLPYLTTILVLTIISRDSARVRLRAPASLGRPFHPAA